MNWRAIGIGVAVGVGASLALGVLFRAFPHDASERPLWIFLALSYVAGGLIDIAVGATAGWLARVRGAMHGLIAGAIATILSPLIGYASFWIEMRGAPPLGLLDFFAGMAISGVIGIAIAAAAGAVAARIAASRSGASA